MSWKRKVRAINVWEENDRRSAFGPRVIHPKDRDVKLPEPGVPAVDFDGVLRGVRVGREHSEKVQHGQPTQAARDEDG